MGEKRISTIASQGCLKVSGHFSYYNGQGVVMYVI